MQGKSISVLLADDSELLRRAIKTVLKMEPRIEVVAESHDMAQTLRMAATLHPDVVLLDLNMPETQEIKSYQVRTELLAASRRVIAMSFSNDNAARELARQYGAGILLDKFNLTTELIPTLLAVSRGTAA
jgi:DNA-binding NarL/FixJ family response regulator